MFRCFVLLRINLSFKSSIYVILRGLPSDNLESTVFELVFIEIVGAEIHRQANRSQSQVLHHIYSRIPWKLLHFISHFPTFFQFRLNHSLKFLHDAVPSISPTTLDYHQYYFHHRLQTASPTNIINKIEIIRG